MKKTNVLILTQPSTTTTTQNPASCLYYVVYGVETRRIDQPWPTACLTHTVVTVAMKVCVFSAAQEARKSRKAAWFGRGSDTLCEEAQKRAVPIAPPLMTVSHLPNRASASAFRATTLPTLSVSALGVRRMNTTLSPPRICRLAVTCLRFSISYRTRPFCA